MWHRGRSKKAPAARPQPAGEDTIAAECESFLSGRYAAHAAALGDRVPVWAWVNVLAHASEADLAAMATAHEWWPEHGSPPGRDWQQAVEFLAAHISGLVANGSRTLYELQHAVLIPIELQLAAERLPQRVRADQLVSAVLAALHEHPSSRL